MTHALNAPRNFFVGVFIRNAEHKFLVVNHSQKKEFSWRVPGGKVMPGELPIIAAARELSEELGISATSLNLFRQSDTFADGAFWHGLFFICNSYFGGPRIMEPEKQDEIRYIRIAGDIRLRPNEEEMALELEEKAGAFYRNGERWMYFPQSKTEQRLLDMAPHLEARFQLERNLGGCVK